MAGRKEPMPELPEVETIRRGLEKVVVGKKIDKFEKRDPKVVRFEPQEIEGLYICGVERRAKILIFYLSSSRPMVSNNKYSSNDSEKLILCHLKMTGQLIWEECFGQKEFCLKKSRVAGGHPSPDWVAKLPNAYTRAIFHFGDGSVLFFNDLRRFGYLKLYDTKLIQNSDLKSQNLGGHSVARLSETIPELAKLGPEPFDFAQGKPSKDFTVEYLMKRASKIPNRKIKQFITDQEIISGVGNIYVDEALFYAGISPLRPVKDIKLSEWQKIKDSTIKSLELGLKYGGSSEDTYVDAFGNQGTMGEHTKVYRRTGQPCPNGCGGKVERISLGGRGTHFCPACQS